VIKSRRMRWAGHVALVGERRGACRFWRGNLRERDHLEDPGIGRRIILKWIFKKQNGVVWTGSIWLMIGTGGGLLWMRWWNLEFHKMRWISWVGEELLASQEGLSSVELFTQYTKGLICGSDS
jgi:hypothetical protein